MGRDYPLGYQYFRGKCRGVFDKNRNEKDTQKIQELIGRGNYVLKELEALYKLKKYRTIKRKYY
jgi:hypothetical protein